MIRRRFILIAAIIALLALIAAIFVFKRDVKAPDPSMETSQTQSSDSTGGQVKSESSSTAAAFDKQKLSIDDPNSVWVVANKRRPLNPKDYKPVVVAPNMKLRLSASAPEMKVSTQLASDLHRLDAAAKAANLPLMLASGYRSFEAQTAVYNYEVRSYGQGQADRQSARPGYSEHQTGLAIDLAPASGQCLIQECFGDMAEGKWLAAHAHEFGFIIRYPKGKESITGYLYEPWHLRYVGPELAIELHKQGNPTLEEFFGLPASPNY